ncbi:hypothetical protein SAMN05192549_108120 [Duganella sacchari]|uniref:PEP-CTERM protein-sorting domain-containing protein n=1 Tax=Duganella sacchari TaxID=551987 RepID=A0A1M7QWH5_9BURK|nr:hypothetical protein [Duganella sacchari]SHN36006.1 hypothetical protein SAMN05192549_108120 [Duganella sacchari]
MKRYTALLLLPALLAVGSASAMRAPDFIDADQRATVTLRDDHPTVAIAVTNVAATTAVTAGDATLLPARQPDHAQSAPVPVTVTSAVPEPSGWAMLFCGALLLLLVPYRRDSDAIRLVDVK